MAAEAEGRIELAVIAPAVAMLLGSVSVFWLRVPERAQAGLQMFSAGLLISAVAGELFPLLSARPGHHGSPPWASTVALIGGFALGLLFMFGLGHITESMEEEEADEGDREEESPKERSDSVPQDLERALLGVDERDRTQAMASFKLQAAEIKGQVAKLERVLDTGCQDDIDEMLHSLEHRVHKAIRVLFVRNGLDARNLSRMKEHCRELRSDAETLLQSDSYPRARDSLKAFQACLEHLHGHAERPPFRRWKPEMPPRSQSELKEHLPLALIAAVTIDAAVDGLLIGLSFAASASAGWAMALATCIEMGFLGLSFSAAVQNSTRSLTLLLLIVALPPVILVLAGIAGNDLGDMLSENPAVFIAFISFSIVALLFLVTQELLTEAQEVAAGSAKINAMFFMGLLAGILLEKYLD